MANTTNYNWETPDDTDLVKDGAAAIRTLGSSIDTTTKNLNPQTTTGALAYRSATANVNTALTIGSTGQVLTVAGGVPTWAAPAGGGKVLQVVQGTLTSDASTTSLSFVDTGITVNITPSSATSKVYVAVNFWGYVTKSGSVTLNVGEYNLVRGATQLQKIKSGATAFASTSNPFHYYAMAFSYLDSPATTSATTYKVQFQADSSGQTSGILASATQIASIVVMEIGA
jgi:hypothetical protein